MFVPILLGILVVVWLSRHLVTIGRQLYVLARLPGPRGSILWGNSAEINALGGVHKAHQHWLSKFGSVVRTWSLYGFFPRPAVVTAAPVLIQHMLRSTNFKKDKTVLRELIGTGLQQNLDVAAWKHQRLLVVPLLKYTRLKKLFITPTVKHTEALIKQWEAAALGNNIVMANQSLIAMSADVMGEFCFSSPFGALADPNNEFVTKFNWVFSCFEPVIYQPWSMATPLHPAKTQLRKGIADVRGILENHVFERMDRYVRGERRDDMLDCLLASDTHENVPLSMKAIVDECLTMLFAGQDLLLAWTFYLLAKNAKWQELTRAEVQRVVGKPSVQSITDNIDKLPLCDRVIKETLRLYPAATVIIRRVVDTEDISYEDCGEEHTLRVPAGAAFIGSIWSMHRSDKYWTKPEEFNPDRFLDRDHAPHAYLPFGAGERGCPGRSFANLQAKVLVAYVLSYFEVELASDDNIGETVHIALLPAGGMPLRLKML